MNSREERRPAGRAVICARISLDRKEETGVNRQLDNCHKLAGPYDLEVVDELVDNSVSAWSGVERPAYTELLRLIARGNVDRVDRVAHRQARKAYARPSRLP